MPNEHLDMKLVQSLLSFTPYHVACSALSATLWGTLATSRIQHSSHPGGGSARLRSELLSDAMCLSRNLRLHPLQ